MLMNLRNAMMAGRLPYDAEVEYLESTGTQWIDTGKMIELSDVVRLDFERRGSANDINKAMFGGRISYTAANGFTVWNATRVTQGRIDLTASANPYIYFPTAVGGRYSLTLSGANIEVNGSALTGHGTITQYAPQYNAYLFAVNQEGTAMFNSANRLYSFSITRNGVLVRDFIPVRKGTVGYLYDRVSKRLFGNQGTGDFVLGPDKNA